MASSVAFFPVYPLAARWLARAAGLRTVAAQAVLSNACGLLAFLLMAGYLSRRGGRPSGAGSRLGPEPPGVADHALLAMALLPTTFFFRMAYTESLFLCLAVLSLYAIERGWLLVAVAVVVGLATGVRPVGAALLLPMGWYAWVTARSPRHRAVRLAWSVPLGCWGLLSFMAYQYAAFGQPLAFALTQKDHRMRQVEVGLGERLLALLSWEPIRDAYDPASPGYWQSLHYVASPLFSLEFANPIYFVGTAALIAVGAWRRWLTRYELLLAVPLLVVPYLTRAYEMRMLSQARFAAVVFPAYVVLGHLLARMPRVVAVGLLALSGLMLGLYAALFAAGYPLL